MKEKLRNIVEDNTSRQGKIFDYFIQGLILISLLSFAVETLPNLNLLLRQFLTWVEKISIVVFTLEYVLRIYVAKKPLKYVFSFYGVIDLLAILPFYLRIAIDLRMLRAFRVFRVFRALKLIRYNRALRRYHIASRIIKEELVLFLITASILLFISASGIYFFENKAQPEHFKSIIHSLWWAIVTLTTVGYGDVYPITIGGKVFTFFMLFIGVGIISVPAGLFASSLSKARTIEQEENNQNQKNLFKE